MMPEGVLTEKQKQFCKHYVETRSYYMAYIRAYGEAKAGWAYTNGKRLLGTPKIIDYIKKIETVITDDVLLKEIDIIQKLQEIAFDRVDKYSNKEQMEALEKLCKVYNMFGQNLNIKNNETIEVKLVE
jgi:phage terminase small subunit